MYRSKSEIEKKLAQAKVLYTKLLAHEGIIFVQDGYDKHTQTIPFMVLISSFLTQTRSIFQYARREAKLKGKLDCYDKFLKEHPIISFFKDLRDIDIHESNLGKQTIVRMESYIDTRTPEVQQEHPISLRKQKPPIVNVSLSKKLAVTNELISKLKLEGQHELLMAISTGKDIYQNVSLNGESDIFKLIRTYMETILSFIKFGTKDTFIS
jgi:hypothetical protein